MLLGGIGRAKAECTRNFGTGGRITHFIHGLDDEVVDVLLARGKRAAHGGLRCVTCRSGKVYSMEVHPVKACSIKRVICLACFYVTIPFKTACKSVGCCYVDKMVRIPDCLKHLFPAEIDHDPVRYCHAHS